MASQDDIVGLMDSEYLSSCRVELGGFEGERIEGSGPAREHLPRVDGRVAVYQSDLYTSLEEGPGVKLNFRGNVKFEAT